jgi:hypothetical protein
MAAYAAATGVDWRRPLELAVGPWRLRLVYSRQGPPYVELIEAVDGSPWPSRRGEPFHHLGVWAEDLDRDAAEAGLELEFDGRPHLLGFAYYRPAGGGARIELLDVRGREAFRSRWEMTEV